MSITTSSSPNKIFHFLLLPKEIQTQILIFCDWETLCRYAKTSKKENKELKRDKWFWKSRVLHDFGDLWMQIPKTETNWRILHRNYRKRLGKNLVEKVSGAEYSRGCLIKALSILKMGVGVDINARDEFGRTALMRACSIKNTIIARKLLELKANPNIKARSGKTALMCVSDGGMENLELVRMLIEHGADPNATDNKGWTAITHATQWGLCGVVEEILNHGGKVGDAIYIALAYNKPRITRLLQKYQHTPIIRG